MSRIDDLIAELCPSGVGFRRLADVARIRNGKDYKGLGEGEIPVFGTGGVMTTVDTAAHPGPSVLIPRKGSLNKLYYVDVPFWTVDTIFYTEIDATQMVPKFFYYLLATLHLEDLNQAGGVPSLTQTVLNSLRIPVPPLEVQREIVRILNLFTTLEAELEAELEARRRQYLYYRDVLLSFDEPSTRWTTLGEICKISRGRVLSKDYLRHHAGPYPVYSSQTANEGVFGFIDAYDYDFESITWTTDGANAGSVFYHSGKRFSITNVCGLLQVQDSNQVSAKYLYYILGQRARRHVSEGMGNPKLMSNAMSRIQVPIPSLEEQARIVAILDKFDILVSDLSIGLPAELAARRKQYEYYRDRLLTFKETAA